MTLLLLKEFKNFKPISSRRSLIFFLCNLIKGKKGFTCNIGPYFPLILLYYFFFLIKPQRAFYFFIVCLLVVFFLGMISLLCWLLFWIQIFSASFQLSVNYVFVIILIFFHLHPMQLFAHSFSASYFPNEYSFSYLRALSVYSFLKASLFVKAKSFSPFSFNSINFFTRLIYFQLL